MKKEYKDAILCMLFSQGFVESMDSFAGSGAYKHQLKNKAKSFTAEVDRFLNEVYGEAQTKSELYTLLDSCRNAVDEVINREIHETDD